MFGRIIGWLASVIFAFSLGAGIKSEAPKTDSELQQKVQSHMDAIVDESAAMVDDVMEEIRKDERVQRAEEFAGDVQEIVDNTMKDIEDHFGEEETELEPTEAVTEAAEEAVTEAVTEENAD